MTRARRIVVCDSAPSRARALVRFLAHDPGLEVAASFHAFQEMLPALGGIAPDLIALDLATAGPDLSAAIESLRRRGPTPVLILGDGTTSGDARIEAALGTNALEAIGRQQLDLDHPEGIWATALRSRIKRLASRPSGHRRGATEPPRSIGPSAGSYGAIGIGASVGGPPALATLLAALPGDFPLPILIVQHMATGFATSLAQWLDRSVAIPVALASEGEELRPGAWLAPDDAHLWLTKTSRLSLDETTKRGAHRPSLDVLLESLAESLGSEAVGVVLTGMGRDGAEGVAAIGAAGGLTIAQDEESSAVFGMPAAAIGAGANEVLPLDHLGGRLAGIGTRSGTQ